jgi:hypothetical protein
MKIKQLSIGLLLSLLSAASGSHELPSNRLTLVLRDDTQLSLIYFIDYAEALRRTMAPERARRDFILVYLAMTPADFDSALIKAHARLSAGTRLALPTGDTVLISNWRWPDSARARSLLRASAMQMLSGGGHHDHDAVHEVHAQAAVTRGLAELTIRLPEELGNVLVVSYQARQAWAEPRAAPIPIRF